MLIKIDTHYSVFRCQHFHSPSGILLFSSGVLYYSTRVRSLLHCRRHGPIVSWMMYAVWGLVGCVMNDITWSRFFFKLLSSNLSYFVFWRIILKFAWFYFGDAVFYKQFFMIIPIRESQICTIDALRWCCVLLQKTVVFKFYTKDIRWRSPLPFINNPPELFK